MVAVKWDARGLVPAVVQDAGTGQVLMLAYMNKEAWEKTLATGKATYYSRSRQVLWHKGETSGNIIKVVEIRRDCENNSLLVKARPTGPVCHTGNKNCYFRQLDED